MTKDYEALARIISASKTQLRQGILFMTGWGIQSLTGAVSCASPNFTSCLSDIGESGRVWRSARSAGLTKHSF